MRDCTSYRTVGMSLCVICLRQVLSVSICRTL